MAPAICTAAQAKTPQDHSPAGLAPTTDGSRHPNDRFPLLSNENPNSGIASSRLSSHETAGRRPDARQPSRRLVQPKLTATRRDRQATPAAPSTGRPISWPAHCLHPNGATGRRFPRQWRNSTSGPRKRAPGPFTAGTGARYTCLRTGDGRLREAQLALGSSQRHQPDGKAGGTSSTTRPERQVHSRLDGRHHHVSIAVRQDQRASTPRWEQDSAQGHEEYQGETYGTFWASPSPPHFVKHPLYSLKLQFVKIEAFVKRPQESVAYLSHVVVYLL